MVCPLGCPSTVGMINRKALSLSKMIFIYLFIYILYNPSKTMNHGVGAQKSPRQTQRAKYPLDLMVFLFGVFLFSYPNNTEVLLQVSCDHSSPLKWNLTLSSKGVGVEVANNLKQYLNVMGWKYGRRLCLENRTKC